MLCVGLKPRVTGRKAKVNELPVCGPTCKLKVLILQFTRLKITRKLHIGRDGRQYRYVGSVDRQVGSVDRQVVQVGSIGRQYRQVGRQVGTRDRKSYEFHAYFTFCQMLYIHFVHNVRNIGQVKVSYLVIHVHLYFSSFVAFNVR